MEKYRKWGLWLRIAFPFFLFVVTGSFLLSAWLYASASRESREQFVTLARTNADFIRTSRLPATERMAVELGRILELRVFFRESDGRIVPGPSGDLDDLGKEIARLNPRAGVVRLDARHEAVESPVDDERSLVMIRPVHTSTIFFRPLTLVILVVFWLLSLVLAWALARGLVNPLRILVKRLPGIESDHVPALPGTERNDEIGLLARTFSETHARLVSERRLREEAERLALLGKMVTGLAHEIHNPLSSIRMHLQLMESAEGTTIPLLLGETAKIENLVNQWMFLARPEPPQTSPAELGGLVEGVVRTIEPMALHARVEIRVRMSGILTACVDSRRLRQAVGNIIINAIQAMPSGGLLQIHGKKSGLGSVLVFDDSGRGFSENALLHFADLFYSEKEGGMGIGLSVCAEIIKALGGTLRVANRPEGGASVTVTLPSGNHPA